MPEERSITGAVIRAFREAKELSQEELANKARLHRTYIGGVERGERNPTVVSLTRILDALSISWADFGREMDRARKRRSP